MTAPLVLGLDLSLSATGVADHDGELSTIKHKASEGDWRLVHIADHVEELAPFTTLAVVEDLPTHAHAAGITGMVHGAARVALLRAGVPYVLVPPSTLKVYATGKGNSKKPELRMELFKRTGADVADDNQVDACWLRLLGLDLLGAPVLDLPKQHRRALDKLVLPASAGGRKKV